MSSIDSEYGAGLDGAVRPSDAETGGDPTAAFYRPAGGPTAAFYRPAADPTAAFYRPAADKGSWWRHWTWRKALGVVGATFAVLFLLHAGAHFFEHNAQIRTTMVADLSSIGCG